MCTVDVSNDRRMLKSEGSEPDDSVILRKVNEALQASGGDDFSDGYGFEIFLGLLRDPEGVSRSWHSASAKWSDRRLAGRKRHARKVNRHISKRMGNSFRSFENSVASAEAINCSMHHAFSRHLRDIEVNPRTPLLGVDGHLSAETIWILTLIGLHARLVELASEILLLLSNGYHAGARARLRTMYETDAKSTLMVVSGFADPVTVAARYYVRGVWDAYQRGGFGPVPKEDAELFNAARLAWGERCLTGKHNWAAPAIVGNPKNVSLRDIIDAAGQDNIIHVYNEGNDEVHVDPWGLIRSAEFDKNQSHLFNMRGDINIFQIARTAHAVIHILNKNSVPVSYLVCVKCLDPDRSLICASLMSSSERAGEEFAAITERYKPKET